MQLTPFYFARNRNRIAIIFFYHYDIAINCCIDDIESGGVGKLEDNRGRI